jgi:multiple sugar transport system permease protein
MGATPESDNSYVRSRRRFVLKLTYREALTGWLFASPWVLGFILFTAWPMFFSLYTSFTRYNIIRDPEWIGTKNYEQILDDPRFYKSLENTFWMVGYKTPIVMGAALGLAVLLNMNLPGEKFFRTMIYFPSVLAGIASIYLWQWILSGTGLFNTALGSVGIDGPAWFTDPAWTKPGLIVMGMWFIGNNVLIYLASLKGIPRVLYEAAEIDGASAWRRARHITLPMISPAIFFEIVTSIIGTFQIFTTAYIISGVRSNMGGPRQSMLFYVLYLYNRAFGRVGPQGLQMGYAAALAWILFVIILMITLIQLGAAKRWVYYETS